MFNFVMGIVMIGIGSISVAHAFFFKKNMAGFIFFGILMIGFGIVELVRSRGVKARKKAPETESLTCTISLRRRWESRSIRSQERC